MSTSFKRQKEKKGWIKNEPDFSGHILIPAVNQQGFDVIQS